VSISIKFKKIHPEARLPTKGKPGDAAYDLYCVEETVLHEGFVEKVRTGLQLADMTPEDGEDLLFLQIEGRSGLASKGVFPLGGIIDGSYRGEIMVLLFNSTDQTKFFSPGDRIAQMIIRRTPKDVLIEETEQVTETSRGSSGFGSTGA
jgi:dUTP pyrophosphatase